MRYRKSRKLLKEVVEYYSGELQITLFIQEYFRDFNNGPKFHYSVFLDYKPSNGEINCFKFDSKYQYSYNDELKI